MDVEDDVEDALILDLISEAQYLLITVGKEYNAQKTKFLSFNFPDEFELKLDDATIIGREQTENKVQDFKYLGSSVDAT